jgi:hypothetical protein
VEIFKHDIHAHIQYFPAAVRWPCSQSHRLRVTSCCNYICILEATRIVLPSTWTIPSWASDWFSVLLPQHVFTFTPEITSNGASPSAYDQGLELIHLWLVTAAVYRK